MDIVDIITVTIAFFALGWNVYRDIIQLPKIRIVMTYSLLKKECPPEKDGFKKYELSVNRIEIRIVNIGRNNIYIKHMVAKEKNHRYPQLIDWRNESKPIFLEPGQEHIREREKIHEKILIGEIKRIGFIDTYGRKHWCPRWKMKKMIKRMQTYPEIKCEER